MKRCCLLTILLVFSLLIIVPISAQGDFKKEMKGMVAAAYKLGYNQQGCRQKTIEEVIFIQRSSEEFLMNRAEIDVAITMVEIYYCACLIGSTDNQIGGQNSLPELLWQIDEIFDLPEE